MNFKRHKPKEKEIVNWHSPREYKEQRFNPNSNPSKKPNWYCKKLKGKHYFNQIDKPKVGTFANRGIEWPEEWRFFECIGCGKQDYKFSKQNENNNS